MKRKRSSKNRGFIEDSATKETPHAPLLSNLEKKSANNPIRVSLLAGQC